MAFTPCNSILIEQFNSSPRIITLQAAMGMCFSSEFQLISTSNNNRELAAERQCPSLSDDFGQVLLTSDLTEFKFKELKTATENFKRDNFVGKGRYGEVYRGWLRLGRTGDNTNKIAVAIKKLHLSGVPDKKLLQDEIQFFGRLRHPNLVKLLGYCYRDSNIFLVYEYALRGSLECHLFGRGSNVQPLSWETRIKIAVQAARAFAFHIESDERVLWRSIKPSNILLDQAYNPKIDICLNKLSFNWANRVVLNPHSFRHNAPEIFRGHLNLKSDIYSFGVVLMELLTGLRAADNNISPETDNLEEWAKPYWSNERNLKTIMDPKLGNYPTRAAMEIAKLAYKCLAKAPGSRPSMKEVLQTLEQIQAIA